MHNGIKSLTYCVCLLFAHLSCAATPAENKQLYDQARLTLSNMQKRVWDVRQWWIERSHLDLVARSYALSTIAPLQGVDEVFVNIDQRAQLLYKAFDLGHYEEVEFHKDLDRLMDEAINKMYWSYIFHARARMQDMRNQYLVTRFALEKNYQQQLEQLQQQFGRLTDQTNARARRLLARIANQESDLRDQAKQKYTNAMQEAVLLRRLLATQILDWINALDIVNRKAAAGFFTMRLYELLEYQLNKTDRSTLASIFAPGLWAGRSVEWVRHNGSSFDRDYLSNGHSDVTFTPMQLPLPGPAFSPTNRTVEIGTAETLNLRARFVQETVQWLRRNHTIRKAI